MTTTNLEMTELIKDEPGIKGMTELITDERGIRGIAELTTHEGVTTFHQLIKSAAFD